MSLAQRLNSVVPARSNRGCETCRWIKSKPAADQQAWQDWIDQDRSLTQLWQIATTTEPDPLQISLTGLRSCIRQHWRSEE